MSSKKITLLLIIVSALITRFYKIDWGSGYFFHPDENNMATAVSQLSASNLNPHFFAYGQFPLYLSYFSLQLLGLANNFPNSIFALRFWSACFSLASLLIFYKIAQKLKINSLLFLLLLTFTPGLIQISHFGTTESLLIFVFASLIYLAFLISQQQSLKLLTLASIVAGIGLATKITAIFFLTPVFMALFFSLLKHKNIFRFLRITCYLLLITLIFSTILSPYSLFEFSNFRSAISYESSVATGISQVFYTRQFINTLPFLFQFTHIFPYTNGLPILFLGIIGFLLLIKNRLFKNKFWLIILISSLTYFLYQGSLFAKWTRFMSPLFFLLPLLTSYFVTKIQKKLQYSFIIISILPGLIFFTLYLHPDNRLAASDWINHHLAADSTILSEAGNVVNLPIGPQSYQVTNFDFYNLDSNLLLQQQLPQALFQNNYLLLPSRRIYKNQTKPSFPTSQSYYLSLFSGKLGFKQIYQHTSFLFWDENAEETWTVFDHPTIRLYQKNQPLNIDQYATILKS